MKQKLQYRVISGCRVMLDPRGSAEAHATRDETNYKAQQKQERTEAWQKRQHANRKKG